MDDLDLSAGPAGLGARFVLGALALTATVVVLASRRRVPAARPVLVVLDRLAGTLLAYERWVVDALTGAAATLAIAAAWTADVLDRSVLGAPPDALSRPIVRAARAARPAIGASLLGVFWGLVALMAIACALHGLWPAR